MATYVVDVPDNLVSFFKKLMAQLGFSFTKGQATSTTTIAATKRPLNKVQQDFVDAYREMIEADKGIGPPLRDAREVLKELREEQAQYWGRDVQH